MNDKINRRLPSFRQEDLLDGLGRILLIITRCLQFDFGAHRGAQRNDAQDASQVGDLAATFQPDGRAKHFGHLHEFYRGSQMQTFAPRNDDP